MPNWKLLGRAVTAPLMGAALVLFLPFIGIGMLLWFSGKTVYESFRAFAAPTRL